MHCTLFLLLFSFGLVPDCNTAGLTAGPDEMLAGGFKWGEGPAADPNGDIYFSDVTNNLIYKYVVSSRKLVVFGKDSGGANGLYIDPNGKLIICEGGSRRVTSIDPNGKKTVLADSFDGKKLNSPNDLWPDLKGGIYFTDPRYGDRSGLELGTEQVYYISPDRKRLSRVTSDLVRPNGIVGTPDGKKLYIADRSADKTWMYDIDPNGTLKNKTLFADQGSDGMTLDMQGNVYLTDKGVEIYNPSGKKLCTIMLPQRPTNLEFGGTDKMTLFVTCPTALYSVPMRIRGI